MINAPELLDIPTVLNKTPPDYLKQHPCCFMVDTDSVEYVLDTDANRVIVNNARLIYGYRSATAQVKGIDGEPTTATGAGFINLPLKSDDGQILIIPKIPVMHVPSCPYNLMPPQLFVKEMKARNFSVKHFKHDDNEYVLKYKPPEDKITKPHTLT